MCLKPGDLVFATTKGTNRKHIPFVFEDAPMLHKLPEGTILMYLRKSLQSNDRVAICLYGERKIRLHMRFIRKIDEP